MPTTDLVRHRLFLSRALSERIGQQLACGQRTLDPEEQK
jgi:hypothetical protein